MSSRDLAAFVAAVETGGIGAAADALCLTQSAVTKRIAQLERRLGARLLVRSHAGVTATDAGKVLYPDAKAALLALSRAARVVGETGAAARKRLALAASHTVGTFLLPGWLASFAAAEPSARPSVDILNSEKVPAAVRERKVEIGFVPAPAPPEGLEAVTVGFDELVVVVAAGHRWARGNQVPPSQLSSELFLTREAGSGTRAAAIAAARRLGIELHPSLETSSIEALKRTVASGGFTILSALAIEDEQAANQLRGLPLEGVSLRRELLAIKRPDAQLGTAGARFWSWLATLSNRVDRSVALPPGARRASRV